MTGQNGEQRDKKKKKDKKEKKEKRCKKEASAVAEPREGGTHQASVEARDDEATVLEDDVESAESRHAAGTKDEPAHASDKSEYEPSDDDKAAQSEQHSSKERAKFRRARPDPGDSADESSSPDNSAAQTRPHGSAVANHSKRQKAAVAASSSTRSAVAEPSSIGSTVVSPSRASLVKDVDGEWYERRDTHQNLGGFGAKDARAFRERQKRRGDPNQRNHELHFPQSLWMVDRDCAADEIDEKLFGPSAKNSHVLVIFIDMAIDEQSKAYDHLCKLADEPTTCSDSMKPKTGYSSPKKSVYRLGLVGGTYAFAVLHNGWISQAMYDDHQGLHKENNDLLRFGTLHVSLSPDKYDPKEKTICMGIVLVRYCADRKTSIDKSDAQMLAKWTERETHDMVIACMGRDTCTVDVWKYFGSISGAKHNCPLYQPVKKPKSAVATKASSDGDPFEPAHGDIFACPQMVFLYGDCTKVNAPLANQIQPFDEASIREGRLLECVVEANEIPLWINPPGTDLAHRQALGEVSIKAIQWDKSPDSVLPMYVWYDHPSKSIVNNDYDATTTDKGKGKGTDKDKGNHKDKGKRLQQSQQQRLQSVTQTSKPPPPPCPSPSHAPKPRRRARSASPRRRSPGRHQSRSSREPRTPPRSPPPHRADDRFSARRPMPKPHPKRSAVASTTNVQRPRVEMHRHQHPKAAVARPSPRRRPSPERRPKAAVALSAPRRSPSPERRSRFVRPNGNSANPVPDDPVQRAKFIAEYAPTFRRNYRRWAAEAPDEQGSLLDDSASSEEDDTGIIEEVEEEPAVERFERDLRELKRAERSSTCTRGESSCRSRSPVRTRYSHPPASEQRRPPAQHAKPYPWAKHSRISQSVRAEAPKRDESRARTASPSDRSAARRDPRAAQAKMVVMKARTVRFK